MKSLEFCGEQGYGALGFRNALGDGEIPKSKKSSSFQLSVFVAVAYNQSSSAYSWRSLLTCGEICFCLQFEPFLRLFGASTDCEQESSKNEQERSNCEKIGFPHDKIHQEPLRFGPFYRDSLQNPHFGGLKVQTFDLQLSGRVPFRSLLRCPNCTFRGPNPPKIPKYQNNTVSPRLHELFRKVRPNFCRLPCDASQEPNGNC